MLCAGSMLPTRVQYPGTLVGIDMDMASIINTYNILVLEYCNMPIYTVRRFRESPLIPPQFC